MFIAQTVKIVWKPWIYVQTGENTASNAVTMRGIYAKSAVFV